MLGQNLGIPGNARTAQPHSTAPKRTQVRTNHDFDAMTRELIENGLDSAQGERYEGAFKAAQVAAVAVLCGRYGTSEEEMLDALENSRNLNAEVHRLVARMEMSPAFVAYIHSGFTF